MIHPDHEASDDRESAGEPGTPITWLIIASNTVVFAVMVVLGDNGLTAQAPPLIAWGGNYDPLTRGGEWWRLLSAVFLHAGLPHLLLNMAALWSGGRLLEHILGASRFAGLYLLAGVAASIGSVTLTSRVAVSVGASGAVLGVYGALLGLALAYVGARGAARGFLPSPAQLERLQAGGPPAEVLGLRGDPSSKPDAVSGEPAADDSHERTHVWQRLAAEILALFGINLAIGYVLPGIDNAAHVTGFVAGFVLGAAGRARGRAFMADEDAGAGVAAPGVDPTRWFLPAAATVVTVLVASAAFGWLPPAARLAALDTACTARVGSACVAAGRLAGAPGVQDASAAASYYERGCDAGHGEACMLLGRLRLAGGAAGAGGALRAFAAACEGGHAAGCTALGSLYEAGRGVEPDPQRAVAAYRRACDLEEADACLRLSETYAAGRGVARDPSEAAAFSLRACEHGAPRGCTRHAAALASGTGAPEDVERAIGFYMRACDRQARDPQACAELGRRYAEGDGVSQDLTLAAHTYLNYACATGHARSCTRAGALFETSPELGVDLTRAADFYQRGCAFGDPAGCFNLGVLYDEGRGPERDPARALVLYEEACRRGMRQVCSLLAGWGIRVSPPPRPRPSPWR